jgi:hypothetical protein
MAICESCGNDYEPSLFIGYQGKNYHFDCFECAAHVLAPHCAHCRTKVLGHGMQAGGKVFCCAHCAKAAGYAELRDSA